MFKFLVLAIIIITLVSIIKSIIREIVDLSTMMQMSLAKQLNLGLIGK